MTGLILACAFFATIAALSLYRAVTRGPLSLPDPEDAWVQLVLRTCWANGDYSDGSIHVVLSRSGWRVCVDDCGLYDLVNSGRIRPLLRAHYQAQLEAAQAELVAK